MEQIMKHYIFFRVIIVEINNKNTIVIIDN